MTGPWVPTMVRPASGGVRNSRFLGIDGAVRLAHEAAQLAEAEKELRMVPEDDLSERRDRLNRSLDERRREHDDVHNGKARSGDAKGFAMAMRLSTEFVAGVLVGGGLGWFLDQWLGTSPWGLIVLLLLGFVAGVLNVLRSAGLMAEHRIRTADEERSGDD